MGFSVKDSLHEDATARGSGRSWLYELFQETFTEHLLGARKRTDKVYDSLSPKEEGIEVTAVSLSHLFLAGKNRFFSPSEIPVQCQERDFSELCFSKETFRAHRSVWCLVLGCEMMEDTCLCLESPGHWVPREPHCVTENDKCSESCTVIEFRAEQRSRPVETTKAHSGELAAVELALKAGKDSPRRCRGWGRDLFSPLSGITVLAA
ncbi:hypothetical protein mRhiFer1_008343 [Rhinolophus ferrumequinum]|uniref:Uncharacterized protein n=1 Tax=Rhinolophus ferrumequinum TaxID=59479 RepID=A0A7J7VEB3_RHIFE|nr:hypothetical protein mRhiFer1_008343 [Rhinolophus ferrumequinum]